MPIKARQHIQTDTGWQEARGTDEGLTCVVGRAGAYSSYKSYSSTVTTGTNATYDCLALLGRKCLSGYVTNDDPGTNISVYIDSTDNTAIVVQPKEILDLEGCNASMIILSTAGTGIAYRILIK